MTRSYEPYGNEWYGRDHGPVAVEKLQKMEFPLTHTEDKKDHVTWKCWYGEFKRMEELADLVTALGYQDSHISAIGSRVGSEICQDAGG